MHIEHPLDYLIQYEHLTDEHAQKIRVQTTRQDKARALLDILPTKGADAIVAFIDSLIKDNAPLHKLLTDTLAECK